MTTEVVLQGSVIREKLEMLRELFTDVPEAARVYGPSATAILESGLSVRTVDDDGASIATDMPYALGGAEAAPSPGWLLSAAAASCTATVIALRSAALDIELTNLEVGVDTDSDARGLLGIGDDVSASMAGFRIRVKIGSADATAEELRSIVLWAHDHSPVVSTIRAALPVDIEVDAA
ncbi:MAG: OsmC family protein [Actinomycetota bacterium]